MKKMLFITPRIPIPANSGGLLSTLSSLKFLAKNYHLDIISFIDDKNENKEKYLVELKKLGVKNVYFIDSFVKKRTIFTIIKSLFSNLPLSIYRNKSKLMSKKIKEISSNYDVLYADHWLTMQFIPPNFEKKVILKEHNAEYRMWERYRDIENNLIKKLYLKFEINKIKKYEAKVCNRASNVIVLTESDKDNLVKIGVNSEIIEMLPGLIINSQEISHSFETKENAIMYVGNLSWEANIDGLIYFLENIYPMAREKVKDLKFYIIGKNPPQKLQEIAENDKSIILTGFVEDLNEYTLKSKIFVVYLRYGSGIKIKILEALSMGLPVVTNSIGMEGIKTEGAYLAETKEEFAQCIEDLINNNAKLLNMSKFGQEYINSNYTENHYLKYFNKIIDKNINGEQNDIV